MSGQTSVSEFRDYAGFVRGLEDEVDDLKEKLKKKREELKKAIEQYVSLGLQEKGGEV
jgi:hypothetical protein